MLIVDVNRPDLILIDEAGNKVSEHRDPSEAAAKAVTMGEGEYMVIQPTISIKVTDSPSE